MEYKETTVKSAVYPFVLYVVGCKEDIECFKYLIEDSSDMSAHCISFSDNRDFESMDPTEYKLEGKTIFEWRKENRALAARVRELESSYDRLVADNHALMDNLVRALDAKPDYAVQLGFIADLEKYILDISDTVAEAIDRVKAYETN